ncbi:hypothetical protein EZ456_04620 [Pedobacter psychrodurus]|uniref:NmrA-like domain-containing protein n=1 Tax=Pedobacter psychrodurus TaxID=2530456 RepID=A0A4R0Q731_9SPHI|nr:NmrA family NAD(P)-binding protein [Pedobacter psychrodurus]TCD28675.1 hypothetical protein EZ456_04620 [Pedobacter psychrodurus]
MTLIKKTKQIAIEKEIINMILITGATGHLGTAVLENMLKKISPLEIAIFARDKKKIQKWKDSGLSIRLGDFRDKENIKRACIGADRLLLIHVTHPDAFEHQKNVIDAAVDSGIKHIYYAGGAISHNVEKSKLGLIRDSYFLTENYIRQSGLQYTIFQIGLYSNMIPYFIGDNLPINGIKFPAGRGKAAFASRDEIGEAIAKIILKKNEFNFTYIFSGKQSYSFVDVANILSDLSGHEITFLNSDQEAFASTLRQHGADEAEISKALLFSEIIKNGAYNICDGTLEQVLERKPTTLREYLETTYCP